ncbi:phage regulatory CII family protein, partial [Escherichia coli]
MFDYQVSKHPHFDEACRAFALRHNLVQLAGRAGMNVQILRNKLNPAQLNRPGFPGECFICELRLPDHRFRWKHNKLFLLL